MWSINFFRFVVTLSLIGVLAGCKDLVRKRNDYGLEAPVIVAPPPLGPPVNLSLYVKPFEEATLWTEEELTRISGDSLSLVMRDYLARSGSFSRVGGGNSDRFGQYDLELEIKTHNLYWVEYLPFSKRKVGVSAEFDYVLREIGVPGESGSLFFGEYKVGHLTRRFEHTGARRSKIINELYEQALQGLADDILSKVTARRDTLNAIAQQRQKDRPQPEPPVLPTKPTVVAVSEGSGAHWAVIIGVGNYADSRIPSLRYAARDAQAFHDWLVDPAGGAYAPSRVRLLTNEEATGRQIRQSLFDWLGQAISEDVVTIYFAGHGSPRSPERMDELYLLPFDADYESIISSAIPMQELQSALERHIPARRVIVIADSCHSGGIGRPFESARRGVAGVVVNPISRGFQELSVTEKYLCIMSATDAAQTSQEDGQWGGGHGVFTYYLLEGLSGKADATGNGVVTVGELMPYLSENIRRATRSAQTPVITGRFDPNLTLQARK